VFSTPIAKTTVLAGITCFSPVEKLCITLRIAWNLGVDGGFQGGHLVGSEVRFNGFRGGVQVVNPCLVALLLRFHGVLIFTIPGADQKLFNPGQPRFDPAQAAGDGLVLLRHLRVGGCCRDCCREHLG